DLEVEEAIDRVTSCSAVGFTEQFESFLSGLSRRLNLPLAIKHERRFAAKVELSTSDLDIARECLAPEIAFVEAVRKACGGDLRDRAREEPSGSAAKEVSHPQPADFSCCRQAACPTCRACSSTPVAASGFAPGRALPGGTSSFPVGGGTPASPPCCGTTTSTV